MVVMGWYRGKAITDKDYWKNPDRVHKIMADSEFLMARNWELKKNPTFIFR